MTDLHLKFRDEPNFISEVLSCMPVRVDSTMAGARSRVYGPLPKHRDQFDPSSVVKASGSQDVLVLDSKTDLPENWQDVDLVSLMYPPAHNENQADSQTDGGTTTGTEVNVFLKNNKYD